MPDKKIPVVIAAAVFIFLILSTCALMAGQDCEAYRGAGIFAQDGDHTYLGKIAVTTDGESIFNDLCPYGDPLSDKSIWNEFSKFGNSFDGLSPFNETSPTPPLIVKDGSTIGYLSANKNIPNAISPSSLKELCQGSL
jgi:hypothetical protein